MATNVAKSFPENTAKKVEKEMIVDRCGNMYGINLGAKPATAIILSTGLFTLLCVHFLKSMVLTTKNQYLLFFIGSYCIGSSYFVFDYYLKKYSSSYNKINTGKRFYVLSNLIKSAVLAVISPLAMHLLYNTIVHDVWEEDLIKNLGCIYAMLDFVSLILVRRMAATTIVHHVCVLVFNLMSIHNDYSKENTCRLIVVYAIFSSFAYMVNLLLATRFLAVSHNVSVMLSYFSIVVYGSCCLINWTWQVSYIIHLFKTNPEWFLYAYCLLMLMVVYDDVVLHKWLCKNTQALPVNAEEEDTAPVSSETESSKKET